MIEILKSICYFADMMYKNRNIIDMKIILHFDFQLKLLQCGQNSLNVRKVYHCQGSKFTDREAVNHCNYFNSHANQTIHGKTTTFLFRKSVIKSTERQMYIAKSLLEIMSEFTIKGINIHYQGSRFIVAFEMQTRYIEIMTL